MDGIVGNITQYGIGAAESNKSRLGKENGYLRQDMVRSKDGDQGSCNR